MRILVLHSRYLSGALSGENSVVDDECALLRSAGHDVRLYAPSVRPSRRGASLAIDAVWNRSEVGAVREHLRGIRPDVVHVHSMFPALSPAVLLALPDSTPVVMTLHNFRYSCLPATFFRDGRTCEDCLGKLPVRGVLHGCYRGSWAASAALATSLGLHRALESWERVRLFLAVSAFVRSKHVQAGLSPEKIRVKPNFAHAVARRQGPGEYLLALGRLTPEKGFDTVVAAAREDGQRLLVVGDGPARKDLQTMAGPNTTFVGPVGRERVPELLRGARALVFPSRCYEGSPRAILEAFAAGVGAIASRIGGVAELLRDPAAGVLPPPDDNTAWISALSHFRDDSVATRAGEAAHELWRTHFSPATALRDLESAYEAVL